MSGTNNNGGNIGVQNSQGGAGESQDYCWQMIKVRIRNFNNIYLDKWAAS
jgi:hypothetical protein